MHRIKLMVIDVDTEYTLNVCRCLAGNPNIKIVCTETNGNHALNSIHRIKPDVVLTDVQLPGLDGIFLLKETHLMSNPPAFIFCTHFYSDYIIENAQRNGAAYFLYKPVDFHFLPNIIFECYHSIHSSKERKYSSRSQKVSTQAIESTRIHHLLQDMGMPPRLIGCMYLIESVLLIHENKILLSNLSKGLYAEIGLKMNTTPSCIERSLRNAISTAYNRGGLTRYFSHRPTNKEFIEYLIHAAENDCRQTQIV